MFRTAEQQTFHNIVRAHMRLQDGPLFIEGGTGLGKTRAYLLAVMQSAAEGKNVAVVLPTHQLIDQLMASSDLVATRGDITVADFRPARMFDTRPLYEANKQAALNASVMFCTAASVIIDHRLGGQYNGVTERGYIVFDEADQLPDMAALQSDFSISADDLKKLGISLTTAKEALMAILARKPMTVEPETRAAAKVILEALDEPAWYQSAGIDGDGCIVLSHKLPGRLLKKVSNHSNVAFVSATLTIGGKFNDFRSAMGIERESSLSSVIEPKVHGRLDFNYQPLTVDTPEWLEAVIGAVEAAPQPVLVATTSHRLSAQLGERIKSAVVRNEEETAAQAAARCDGILIAAGAWAGLDTPLRWRTIIVPRIPFGQPEVVEGVVTTSYIDARNVAVRRLRQVIGRGLRTPDAVCSIHILDARAARLSGFVPARFLDQWGAARTFAEGGRTEIVLSKNERDPAVRRAALRHYGAKCMACPFTPRVDSQLDVHHLDPIAEGERKTRLEDVVVLCANCHRLAHSTKPPADLTKLREWTNSVQ